jgi:hypothetical protein
MCTPLRNISTQVTPLLEKKGRPEVKTVLMANGRIRNRIFAFALLALCAVAALTTVSCSSNESKVKKTIEEHLKSIGVTEVIVDFFYTDPNFPDKAYTGATVTYSFATAAGKPQREFLGFILAREGDGWRIERSVAYTKEAQKAAKYLAGSK